MSEQHPGYAVATLPPSPGAVSKTNESASAMLAARARAEIEARTIVALNRPRDLGAFRAAMLAACLRPAFADAALWERPVGGNKTATGLSIRFAEEAARHYRNLDVSVSVVAEDDESRTIEAIAIDLEANIVHRAQGVIPKYVERSSTREGDEVVRSRTNSRGNKTFRIRANDDALFTEHQKMAAKLKREAVLFHIPSDIKEECEEQIEATLKEIGSDPEKFRVQVVQKFERAGVSEAQIAKYLGKSLGQANLAELRMLRRVFNAITQGETTWEAFTHRGQPQGASAGASDLNAALGAKEG